MYQALTFNLGESLELSGCKSCYFKDEKDVYYPEIGLNNKRCHTLILSTNLTCGDSISSLNKIMEFQKEKENCLLNETFRFNNKTRNKKLEASECVEGPSQCCITKTNEIKQKYNINDLSPKSLFHPCYFLAGGYGPLLNTWFEFCTVAGEASLTHCLRIQEENATNFQSLVLSRFKYVLGDVLYSSSNETVFFYSYSWTNQTLVVEEKGQSSIDPKTPCGFLIFRHDNVSQQKLQEMKKHSHTNTYHYNEDACRTHLKSLQVTTSIYNLHEWKTRTDYMFSKKVGGKTCELLRIYGISIIFPICLNLFFTYVLFSNDVREGKASNLEIIPVILLVYPQYKTIKFIVQYLFIHHDETQLNLDKTENDRTLASLEPFLESSFQVRK